MEVLGIDIGGSGIKAAVVETTNGAWQTERYRIDTPQPPKHEAMVAALSELQSNFKWQGPVGCGFPGVIQDQTIQTAANLHKSLLGKQFSEDIAEIFGEPACLINDADAAGIAEMQFGGADPQKGVVLFLTIGTGIGTAVFNDGKLVPNSEFGHMLLPHKKHGSIKAEHYAADSARKRDDLKWSEWAERFNEFLEAIHFLLRPVAIIVGGGVAKRGNKFLDDIESPCPLRLAELKNRAGIIGAALNAENYL